MWAYTRLNGSRAQPVSHYRIALQKSLPGRRFTDKNPPRPTAALAGRIFTGKSSAGGDFSVGERSYNGETFYGAGNILIWEDVPASHVPRICG